MLINNPTSVLANNVPRTFNNTNKYSNQNPQSSTRISFQDNPYTIEERHAGLSEPVEPVTRQAALSKPHHEPEYNIYPSLQQDLNRARHQSQNQNTLEINRQIINPQRNRNLQNTRVQFNIPHSPTTNPINFSSSKFKVLHRIYHNTTYETLYQIF